MENVMMWFFGAVAVFLLGVVLVVIPIGMWQDAKIDTAYKSGSLTLEQYCDKKTNHGTDSRLPVACYPIYNVKANGEECHFNAATKTTQCKTILVPN